MNCFNWTPLLCGLLLTSGACVVNGDADDDGSTGAMSDTDPQTTTTSTTSGTTSTTGSDGSSSTTEADGSSGSGTTGGSSFMHCEPQPEQPMSGSDTESFANNEQEALSTTDSLSSPAGGYLQATFSPGLARGALRVFGVGDTEIFGTNEQDVGETVVMSVLIAPDTSYRLVGEQAQGAMPNEYPFDASIEWTLTPIPDCWEPNNTMEDASEIELGHPITGYINAGEVAGDQTLQNEDWLDWYQFEVAEAGELVIDMSQVPGDGLVRTRVSDADGNQVGGVLEPNDPETPFEGRIEIDEAGTYWLEVNPFLRPIRQVGDLDDGEIPVSWTRPYIFELTLEPA